MLPSLAKEQKRRLVEQSKLCPPPPAPVPTTIPAFYSKVARDDWGDPAWKCLGADVIETTSVQLEVTSTALGTTFVARGIPFPKENKIVEWKLEGQKSGATTSSSKTSKS
jgi:hypothetical protein